MTTAELHMATGAYVLHALSPAERTEFERHLAACGACEQEVAELAATAARLGLAVAVAAPERMRDDVLRRITTVRQDPPQVPVRTKVRGWTRTAPRWALAACLAVAAAFGGVAVWQYQAGRDAMTTAREAEARAAELAEVLAAPDAKVAVGSLGDGARGTVIVSRERDRAAFIAAGLPKPPDGKVYQLWFDDGDAMRPAGLLSGQGSDRTVLLDGKIGGATGMGITVEPAGGSPQPTTDPVGLMKFPA
ncbi:anti-sigma factor domain-containing protein [Streptomyces sp. NPDC050418]|uniref:anti-sigma factor n=1 Tax=Streptomyces sp. NPDC050418 TaxID=3365612 RepID=UPI00379937C9